MVPSLCSRACLWGAHYLLQAESIISLPKPEGSSSGLLALRRAVLGTHRPARGAQ